MSQTPLKKLQARIFRGQNGDDDAQDPSRPARSSSDPALTINIPNSVLNGSSQGGPTPPKMAHKNDSSSPKQAGEQTETHPFRQRLVEKLGSEYHGAERFRLDQDEARKIHWKRWGPYLSDRQWVRVPSISSQCPLSDAGGRAYRQLYVKITPRTATRGVTSLTSMPARVSIGGAKTASEAYLTTISDFVSRFRYGTARIAC